MTIKMVSPSNNCVDYKLCVTFSATESLSCVFGLAFFFYPQL